MIVTLSQMEAITEAANARRDMRNAYEDWTHAVNAAIEAGAANEAIANACGVSEGTIRAHRRRNGYANARLRGTTQQQVGATEGTPTSLSATPNPPLSPDETEG